MPEIIVIDEVPDSAEDAFAPIDIDADAVSHLQYTGGATRPPVGVEITHRAVGINLLQMILSIDLLDRNTHGVSWLPLYHDMGLSMIGFPAVYGGHSTLMSPTAFIRRPQRWIQAMSAESRNGRVVTAAPNFAYEWTAQRGVPGQGEDIDLGNVVMIIGSEPVSMDAIETFNEAFAPYGLPRDGHQALLRHRRGDAVRLDHRTHRRARVTYLDREQLPTAGRCRVVADAPNAVAQVSCGQIARSQWARDRRPGHRRRTRRRSRRGDLVAGRQHRPRLLGETRRHPADIRRAAATRHWVRAATLTAQRSSGPGCGRVIWGSTSTASSTSPGDSPIW